MQFIENAAINKADTEFHSGVYESPTLMDAWLSESAQTSQLAFYIGRGKQYANDYAAALLWYEEAITRLPVFPWTFYERSEIYEKTNNISAMAEDLLKFLSGIAEENLTSQVNNQHKEAILRKGHLVFGTNVLLSRQIYSSAINLGIFDYLSLLRIIEGLLDHGLFAKADDFAAMLQKEFTPDAFGLLALSRLAQGKNNAAQAEELIEKAGEMLPTHLWLRGQVCARLIELGSFAKAEAAVSWFATDPRLNIEDVSRRLPMLQFRLAVRRRDVHGALTIAQDIDFDWSCVEIWIYAEAVYIFARYGQVWTPDEEKLLTVLCNYLLDRIDDSDSAYLAVLHYYTASSQWEGADALIKRALEKPIYENRDMVIRRFEVACQMQDLKEAQSIYSKHWQNKSLLNVSELALSMRLLSELKDWESAAQVAAELLTRGTSSAEDAYGTLLIVRRAGQHLRFLEIIKRANLTDQFAQKLQELIVDDLCILNGSQKFLVTDYTHQISTRNSILVKEKPEPRSEFIRVAGFICSDRAYFVSAFTLIASLASNVGHFADWHLFISNDVPKSWTSALQDFCLRISFELKIIPEEDFFNRSKGCPTDYGLFSGGRQLARSAYFRIYAAEWLLQQHTYSQAIYLDSDIICQGDISSLLLLQLGDAPLAARTEEYGAAVVKAAQKCEVSPDNYFNSGVLLFNFDNPTLPKYLRDAIWQSENAGDRLTFHDQCALNIAFAGKIDHLPDQYNTFLRPFRTHSEELESGILLHYLDRPKPWDPGFRPNHRLPWMLAAAVVKALVPSDIYNEILAAGIGQTISFRP